MRSGVIVLFYQLDGFRKPVRRREHAPNVKGRTSQVLHFVSLYLILFLKYTKNKQKKKNENPELVGGAAARNLVPLSENRNQSFWFVTIFGSKVQSDAKCE